MSAVAQRLRQKLLDLAIHGKLVPQDENDEPAEALLARIRAERFQTGFTGLGKDGRVEVARCRKCRARRPATAVPISDGEQPFDLPKGWYWCRLGEITTKVGAGSTPQGGKKVYLASGVKFIREQNVYCDGLHNDGMAFIDEVTNQRMSGTIVCPGDMLMNITGGSIGRTALVPDDFDIGNVNQHVLIIRAAEPETRKYIHLVLCSPLILRLMFSRQTGDKPGLSAEKVKAFPIPIPPLAEQKRIVAALDGMLSAADAIAAGTEKIAALKEKVRAKILDLAIRGKLVKQDKNDESAEELLKRIAAERARLVAQKKLKKEKPLSPIEEDDAPYDLPRGWAWCRFVDVINYLRPDPYIVHSEDYDDSYSTPVLTAGLTFILGRTNEADGHYHASKQKPVIIFDDFTTSTQWVDFEFKVKSSAMKLLEPISADLVDLRYLYFAIQNVQYKPSTHSRQWIDKFSKFPLALPPLAEQHRIVAKVDEMLAACDALTGGARGA